MGNGGPARFGLWSAAGFALGAALGLDAGIRAFTAAVEKGLAEFYGAKQAQLSPRPPSPRESPRLTLDAPREWPQEPVAVHDLETAPVEEPLTPRTHGFDVTERGASWIPLDPSDAFDVWTEGDLPVDAAILDPPAPVRGAAQPEISAPRAAAMTRGARFADVGVRGFRNARGVFAAVEATPDTDALLQVIGPEHTTVRGAAGLHAFTLSDRLSQRPNDPTLQIFVRSHKTHAVRTFPAPPALFVEYDEKLLVRVLDPNATYQLSANGDGQLGVVCTVGSNGTHRARIDDAGGGVGPEYLLRGLSTVREASSLWCTLPVASMPSHASRRIWLHLHQKP